MVKACPFARSATSLGVSPHHWHEVQLHLRQRRNIVHLCRAGRQRCSRFTRNDVACKHANDVVPCGTNEKKNEATASFFFWLGCRDSVNYLGFASNEGCFFMARGYEKDIFVVP